jgi:hypothetical protein
MDSVSNIGDCTSVLSAPSMCTSSGSIISAGQQRRRCFLSESLFRTPEDNFVSAKNTKPGDEVPESVI